MEKGLALLGKLHDGDVGSFTGPQLIQLAGHFPAGFTHFEEHIRTLKYLDHRRIIQGKEIFDVSHWGTSTETDCPGDCTIATIDPPAAADGGSAIHRVKNSSRYYRFSEVRKQVGLTVKAVGRKALNIHRTIRGTETHRADA